MIFYKRSFTSIWETSWRLSLCENDRFQLHFDLLSYLWLSLWMIYGPNIYLYFPVYCTLCCISFIALLGIYWYWCIRMLLLRKFFQIKRWKKTIISLEILTHWALLNLSINKKSIMTVHFDQNCELKFWNREREAKA